MFQTGGTSTLATLEKYRQYREASCNTPSQYATLDKYCTINRQPEYATIGKYRTIAQVPSEYETIDHYRTYGKEPQYAAKLDNAVTYKYYGQYDEIVYTPTPSLCYVIVTCRSLLWTLLTLGATLIVVASIITPQWLIGKPKWVGLRSDTFNGTAREYHERTYNPTIGIFNRCTKVHRFGVHKDHCATYVTGFDMPSSDFSDYWKSALILFTVAVIMLGVTVISAIFSLCVRAVFRKSIFTVSGLIQSIAGLFLIVGMILYPVGWGSDRVKNLCGDHAGPFMIDECSLGWAFFACIGGIILVFVCAVLSIQADVSTSSDKVENEILEGKNLICIM